MKKFKDVNEALLFLGVDPDSLSEVKKISDEILNDIAAKKYLRDLDADNPYLKPVGVESHMFGAGFSFVFHGYLVMNRTADELNAIYNEVKKRELDRDYIKGFERGFYELAVLVYHKYQNMSFKNLILEIEENGGDT